MAARDRWCQIRMTDKELARLQELIGRMKGVDNRSDVIRALVEAEHERQDRNQARSRKSEKSEKSER